MGTDKAGLVINGEPLWKRQVATLRAVGAAELFVSGRATSPYAGEGLEIVEDLHPGCGPLAGLEAALHRATTPYLLVLAIDLPAMRPEFLKTLVSLAITGRTSIVPHSGQLFEPLAAVYSQKVLGLVEQSLRDGDYSMQHFIRRAVECNLASSYPLGVPDLPLFRNVNQPDDLI